MKHGSRLLDQDSRGRTVLHWACSEGSTGVVKQILDSRYGPQLVRTVDFAVRTPLDVGDWGVCDAVREGPGGAAGEERGGSGGDAVAAEAVHGPPPLVRAVGPVRPLPGVHIRSDAGADGAGAAGGGGAVQRRDSRGAHRGLLHSGGADATAVAVPLRQRPGDGAGRAAEPQAVLVQQHGSAAELRGDHGGEQADGHVGMSDLRD